VAASMRIPTKLATHSEVKAATLPERHGEPRGEVPGASQTWHPLRSGVG
jgi:hypothetical protein